MKQSGNDWFGKIMLSALVVICSAIFSKQVDMAEKLAVITTNQKSIMSNRYTSSDHKRDSLLYLIDQQIMDKRITKVEKKLRIE